MTLIFGNLVQSFVNFGTTLTKIKAGDSAAQAELPAATASFWHIAAKDAATLVYISELSCTDLVASFLITITGVAMFSAHSHICTYLFTLGKPVPSGCKNAISKPCYVKILPSLIMWERAR